MTISFSLGNSIFAQVDGALAASRPLDAWSRAGLPMSFEANAGQFVDDVHFQARGAGYSVLLRSEDAVFVLTDSPARKFRAHPTRSLGVRRERGQARATSAATPVVITTLRLSLVGGQTAAAVNGEAKLPGTVNYLLGNDPSKWRTGVSTYERVRYTGVYPGIDLVYYGNQRKLEYDFIVAPGADPEVIRVRLEGADRLTVDAQGDLIVTIGSRYVRWQKPYAFQDGPQGQEPVSAEFVLASENEFVFRLGEYDASRTLVIDPLLVYSTYLGGGDEDVAFGVAVDNQGNTYLAGRTISTNFPVFRPYQANAPSGGSLFDVFITKLNSNATARVFSTYLGGNGDDWANDIKVDASGNVYVTGFTDSSNFPLHNAFQTSKGNFNDAFLTKLGPFGTNLLYSTYYGDSGGPSGYGEEAYGLAVNNSGGAWIVGQTESLSALRTKNNILQQGGQSGVDYSDALVARFDTTQSGSSSLIFATPLGKKHNEFAYGVAVDGAGNVYITGVVDQVWDLTGPLPPDFTIVNAAQPSFGDGQTAGFVTKFNNASSPSIVFSTYLGGSGFDVGYGIAVDSSTNVYVVGETSSPNFPVVNGHQSAHADGANLADAFLTKISRLGTSFLYSTYLGGNGFDGARTVAIDRFDNAYIVGYTEATDFPATPGAPQPARGGTARNSDLFVAKINPSIPGPSSLVFATYYGGGNDEATVAGIQSGLYDFFASPGIGLALDTNLNVYIASDTISSNLPSAGGGVYQVNPAGGGDAFVAKFTQLPDVSVALTASTNLVIGGNSAVYSVQVNNNGLGTFSNIVVTYQAPPQMLILGGVNFSGTYSNFQDQITLRFNPLTNGASGLALFTNVTIDIGIVTNTVSLTALPADVNTNNNHASVSTAIRGVADLGLTMAATPAPVLATSNITYRLTLTNSGPWAATPNPNVAAQIRVITSVPTNAEFVSAFTSQGPCAFTGTEIICLLLGSIPGGGVVNITNTLRAQVSDAPLVTTASVVAFAEVDPNLANNSASSSTTITPLSDLAITSMTASPNPVTASSNITFVVNLANNGPSPAGSAQLVNTLPPGSSYVSATSTQGTCTHAAGVVTCNLGTISSNGTATVTIVARSSVVGPNTNSAVLNSASTDLVTANNSASAVTTVNALADLQIIKSVVGGPAVEGGNLTYLITISNRGPTYSTNLVVTDVLPPETQLVSAQSSQGAVQLLGNTLTGNLGSLNANANATVSLTVRPLLQGGLTNTATVVAGVPDPVAGNNASAVATTVQPNPVGPLLRIARTGTSVVLYWSTNSAGWYLQRQHADLMATNWVDVTNTPVAVGRYFWVTNAVSPSETYYRLARSSAGPLLSASIVGGNVQVTWPASFTGYFLQATTNLTAPVFWTTISNPPPIVNNEFRYTEPATNLRRFFRLLKFG